MNVTYSLKRWFGEYTNCDTWIPAIYLKKTDVIVYMGNGFGLYPDASTAEKKAIEDARGKYDGDGFGCGAVPYKIEFDFEELADCWCMDDTHRAIFMHIAASSKRLSLILDDKGTTYSEEVDDTIPLKWQLAKMIRNLK